MIIVRKEVINTQAIFLAVKNIKQKNTTTNIQKVYLNSKNTGRSTNDRDSFDETLINGALTFYNWEKLSRRFSVTDGYKSLCREDS